MSSSAVNIPSISIADAFTKIEANPRNDNRQAYFVRESRVLAGKLAEKDVKSYNLGEGVCDLGVGYRANDLQSVLKNNPGNEDVYRDVVKAIHLPFVIVSGFLNLLIRADVDKEIIQLNDTELNLGDLHLTFSPRRESGSVELKSFSLNKDTQAVCYNSKIIVALAEHKATKPGVTKPGVLYVNPFGWYTGSRISTVNVEDSSVFKHPGHLNTTATISLEQGLGRDRVGGNPAFMSRLHFYEQDAPKNTTPLSFSDPNHERDADHTETALVDRFGSATPWDWLNQRSLL